MTILRLMMNALRIYTFWVFMGVGLLIVWKSVHTMALTSDHGDNCQTLTSEIVVTKDKTYQYDARRVRLMCVAKLLVNKCEGLCTSQVAPSVVRFPGFKKVCRCCREMRLLDRRITLSECYDGTTLVPGQFTTMFIREPSDCTCSDCAI